MIQLSIRPSPPGTDNRRNSRVPVALGVSFWIRDEWTVGKTANISAGGVFIVTDVIPAIGTPIRCELRQDDSVFLTGTGVVRWQKAEEPGRGFGVEFDMLDKTSQARLLGIVEAHLRGDPPAVEEKSVWPWRR